MLGKRTQGPRRRPQDETCQPFHLPAPTGGLNLISPATALPPTDCLALYNCVCAELGLRARLGYREWCTGLTGTDANEIRTILPFTGSTNLGTNNKLFACTEDGIWDVSNSAAFSDQTNLVMPFPSKSANSGRGVGHVVVTLGGHFLLYCDEENGYFVYTESTGTWAQVQQGSGGTLIDGVDPGKFVSVTVWGNRVWFTERDSARAWYLPVNQIYGTVQAFNFGTKFRSGGDLRGLFNWTNSGVASVDDKLVAISGGGDVVVFEGSDPDQSGASGLFNMRGYWFVGAVPFGRNIASSYGGDLLILSSLGVVPLSLLSAGANPFDQNQYLTAKITPLMTQLMNTSRGSRGWSIRIHPQDNVLLVMVPTAAPDANGDTQPTTQLAYSFATKTWSQYGPIDSTAPSGTRGLPILSAEVWDGKLYFGTVDGRVCVSDVYLDNVTLANPNSGADVQCSFLTGFSDLDSPRQKRIGILRPVFTSGDSVNYKLEPRYELDQADIAAVTDAAGGANSWDVGLWDSAVWGPDQQATMSVVGGFGMGVHVALAGRFNAKSRTILAGVDGTYEIGGIL